MATHTMLVRAADRFRTSQPGIESAHVFSAGPHYDPARLGAGALIGLDEHVLEPGAGFAPHAHRGVDIVSWVVSGALLHRGAEELLLQPPRVLVQTTGDGVQHEERNASGSEPLRLVQLTLVSELGMPHVRVASPPVVADEGRFSVLRGSTSRLEPPTLVHVVTGTAQVGRDELLAGDTATYERRADIVVDGEVLIWSPGRWN